MKNLTHIARYIILSRLSSNDITEKASQFPLESLHRIATFQQIVIHPNDTVLLRLLLIFHLHKFQQKAIMSQADILRTN